MNAPTPPEKCPVCEAKQARTKQRDNKTYVTYFCDAVWLRITGMNDEWKTSWVTPCWHAMTAALRCGATLKPTPLELARQALVDAAVRERGAWQTLNAALDADFDTTWQHAQAHHAASETFDAAVAAYRALLEPAP